MAGLIGYPVGGLARRSRFAFKDSEPLHYRGPFAHRQHLAQDERGVDARLIWRIAMPDANRPVSA